MVALVYLRVHTTLAKIVARLGIGESTAHAYTTAVIRLLSPATLHSTVSPSGTTPPTEGGGRGQRGAKAALVSVRELSLIPAYAQLGITVCVLGLG